MKKNILLFVDLFLVTLIFLFTGCSPSTTVTKIYLQEVEVSGPINQTPVHITDSTKSGITISPRFSFNTKKSLMGKVDQHTKVNSEGVFQVDTIFNNDGTFYFQETPGANTYLYTGKNLTWNIAEVKAAVDVDFKLSKTFALFMGANYSVVDQKSLWGGLFGLGLISSGNIASFRIDFGLNIQEMPYEAYTIVSVTETSSYGTSSYVADYLDIAKETNFSPFFNLTLNSSNPEWLFNIFFKAGYCIQKLVNFTPETQVYHNPFYYSDTYVTEDLRSEATAGIFDVTPGLHINFGNSGRIIFGAKFNWIVQVKESDDSFQVIPMLQFDFTL
jgi:hypothetical protein